MAGNVILSFSYLVSDINGALVQTFDQDTLCWFTHERYQYGTYEVEVIRPVL